MISDQPEPRGHQPSALPAAIPFDMTHDSVRTLGNGERVKVMIVMDITDLTESQRKTFTERCLAVLTRMGKKVIEGK